MLFYVFITVFVFSLFLSFTLFDLLIRLQYNEDRNSWVKDGKPVGMFFFPKESSLSSRFHKSRIMWEMMFRTPGWAENDRKAKRLLFYYRITVITINLVILSPLLLMFL